jgi:transcriptional regulator with XRE-family HTH domain
MDNLLDGYDCHFSVEERKQIVAQTIQEFRKAKKLTQKDVAEAIGVKLPTYSTYETGRSEPPIEILVRLSYLLDVSIDVLVQKERTYRNNRELTEQINAYKAEIAKAEEVLAQQEGENPEARLFVEGLKKMLEAVEEASKNEQSVKRIKQFDE